MPENMDYGMVKELKMYRIFIVEDDPGIAGAVERKLRDWGFDV